LLKLHQFWKEIVFEGESGETHSYADHSYVECI
jgi:hypothetical protein